MKEATSNLPATSKAMYVMLLLVAITVVIKILVSANVLLGNDEVYYTLYARYADIHYFDHPLMISLWIKLTTLNGLLQHELAYRASSLIISCINMRLLYVMARKACGEWCGILAVLLYNSSVYFNVIAGLLILPDTPMIFFWILALQYSIGIFTARNSRDVPALKFILLAITIGLCMLSKLHSILFWFGIAVYIIGYDRKWLTDKRIYFCFAASLLFLVPVVYWNVQHHLITFAFHSARAGNAGFNIHPGFFGAELLGEFLYQGPVNSVLYIMACIQSKKIKDERLFYVVRLLLCLALPVIIIFWAASFFMQTLPHWSGPGYTALIILTAILIATKKIKTSRKIPLSILIASVFICVVLVVAVWAIRFAPLSFGKQQKEHFGQHDLTLEMMGWKQFAPQFAQWAKKDSAYNKNKNSICIISSKWFPAAHLDHYVATPNHFNFQALGAPYNIHQYIFINNKRPSITTGSTVYFITSSNNFSDPHTQYPTTFTNISLPVYFPVYRSGKLVKYFLVYTCKGYQPG
jgi:Dolichyl-phosphate-mannose-protein mannosyltransferase